MAAFPAQAGGALQASYHGHREDSAAPEEGLTLIQPPAKRPSRRANPCHAASFKSLDIKVAPFLCLALVSTLQKAGKPGCGASPPLESLAHLTWLELPHCAVCQLGFGPTSSSWPGATLPSLPAPFGDVLFPSPSKPFQASHGATASPRGGFQPPHWSSMHGV